jgi:hypothetical protein
VSVLAATDYKINLTASIIKIIPKKIISNIKMNSSKENQII